MKQQQLKLLATLITEPLGQDLTLAVDVSVCWIRRFEEGPMFQMINEEKPTAYDRKMLWVKVGLFIVLIAALGGVVYFFATTPFGK